MPDTLQDAMTAMSRDKDFAALPYDQQKVHQTEVAQSFLEDDEGFAAMKAADQQNALAKIVASYGPAYQDPRFQAISDSMAKSGKLMGAVTSADVGFANTFPGSMAVKAGAKVSGVMGMEPDAITRLLTDPTNPDSQKYTAYLNDRMNFRFPPAIRGAANQLAMAHPVFGAVAGIFASDNLVTTASSIGMNMAALGPAFQGVGAAAESAGGALLGSATGAAAEFLARLTKFSARITGVGAVGVGNMAADKLAAGQKITAQDVAGSFVGWAGAEMGGNIAGSGKGLVQETVAQLKLRSYVFNSGLPRVLKELTPEEVIGSSREVPTAKDPRFGLQMPAVKDILANEEEFTKAWKANAADPQEIIKDPEMRMRFLAQKGMPLLSDLQRQELGGAPRAIPQVRAEGSGGLDLAIRPRGDGTYNIWDMTDLRDGTRPLASALPLAEVYKIITQRHGDYLEAANKDLDKAAVAYQRAGGALTDALQEAGLGVDDPQVPTDPRTRAAWEAKEQTSRELNAQFLRKNSLIAIRNADFRGYTDVADAMKAHMDAVPEGIASRSSRPGLQYGEASDLASRPGVTMAPFTTGLSDAALESLRKGNPLVGGPSPIQGIKPSGMDTANAAVFFSRAASDTDLQGYLAQTKENSALALNLLARNGFDAIRHDNGTVTALRPDLQIKHLSDFVDPASGKYRAAIAAERGGAEARAAALAGPAAVRQTVSETFAGAPNADTLARVVSASTLGETKPENIALMAKAALAERGMDAGVVTVRRLQMDSPSGVKITSENGKTTVLVPQTISDPATQAAFLKNFSAEVTKTAEGTARLSEAQARGLTGKKLAAYVSMTADEPKGAAYSAPHEEPALQRQWLDMAMSKAPGYFYRPNQDGTFTMYSADKVPFSGPLSQVIDEFLVQNTTRAALAKDLAARGLFLKGRGGETRAVDASGKQVGGTYPDHVSFMKGEGIRPTKIDGRFGPEQVFVNPDESVTFSYQGKAASGSLQDMRVFMSKFTDTSDAANVRQLAKSRNGTFSTSDVTHRFTVNMPEYGIHRDFTSLEEAQRYLSGEYKDFKDMVTEADKRGMALFRRDGKYAVATQAGTVLVDSKDEVWKVLGRSPDPTWAPPLADGGVHGDYASRILPQRTYEPVLDPPREVQNIRDQSLLSAGGTLLKSGTSAVMDLAGNMLETPFSRIAALARGLGPWGAKLAQSFSDARGVLDLARQRIMQDTHALKALYGDLFNDKDARVAIGHYLEATTPEGRMRVLSEYSPSQLKNGLLQKTAEGIREYISGSAPGAGKFSELGNTALWLQDFFPRVRDFMARRPDAAEAYETAGREGFNNFLSELYGRSVPKGFEWASGHLRVSDAVQMAREEDSFVALSRYLAHGNLSATVGPNMENLYGVLHGERPTDLAGKADQITAAVDNWIKVVHGIPRSDMDAMTRSVATSLHQSLNTESAGALLRGVMNIPAFSLFMAKPMSGVKIIDHTYTYGAGYVGEHYINDAVGRLADRGKLVSTIAEMVDKNLINDRAPSVEPTNFGGRVGAAAMKAAYYFIQQGHAINRALVYDAAGAKFDSAMAKMESGALPATKLGDYLNASRMRGPVRDRMNTELFTNNNRDAARYFYQKEAIDQACFRFEPEEQGAVRNSGVAGRLWGQFMTVPMQAATLVKTLATSGSLAERATALATIAKNSLAMSKVYNAIGINGNSWAAWNHFSLTGGPNWNLMTTALKAMSTNPGEAKQARDDLRRQLGTVIPGVAQEQRLANTGKYLLAGQPWSAFMNLMGASIRSDLAKKIR
jgi:hypothetical protein